MIEDKILLWKMKHGSSDALCRIYEKYKGDLFSLANSLLHDLNTAEDVVHDVFVSFVKSADVLLIFHVTEFVQKKESPSE